MPKRFTATEIWSKEWFMNLSPVYKSLWFYIKDECDCIGVWKINKRLTEFIIGEKINFDDFFYAIKNQIEFIDNDKIWLVDFCNFQYGNLNENCKPHQKYINELKKIGLYERVLKGYCKGINTLQEKEEEKEEDKDKGQEKGSQEGENNQPENFSLLPPEIPAIEEKTEQEKNFDYVREKLHLSFSRRKSTEWSKDENKKLKELCKREDVKTECDDIVKLRLWYKFSRKDLVTLLNNWSGELDKARKEIPDANNSLIPLEKINNQPKIYDSLKVWREENGLQG